MRIILRLLSFLIAIGLYSCAKQSSPMGGPKDEEPPILLYSNPPDQSTNIKPSEIDLEFNEFVKIENPNQSVIITPRLEKDKIEYLAIKNRINININQDLEDNTTYLFNFQKSVQDITESNPANRLKLVFSTGESIDSLSVSGQVAFTDPYAELEFDDVLVGLYAADDTTDLFTAPPYYIAQPDSTGRFEITNIKAGEFRAYAWHDENNSLKAEYRNEAYGFAPDIISVDTNKEGLFINIAKGDLSDLKINRGTITGRNFDIVLSKPIAEFSVSHPDKNKQLFYRIQDKTIRLYHTEMRNDSTEIGLLLKDSVGFLVDTTFYATFEESDRSKEKLEITTNTGLKFVNTIQAKLHFNKPIVDINYDSLYLKYDSARLIPILPEMVRLPDSTHLRTDIFIDIPLPDTVSNNAFTLYASDSTFRDAEDMWNEDPVEAKYTRLKTDNLADGINGKINTPERPIILQLLNSKGEIIQEKYLLDTNYFEFNNIEATNYSIQAIIDKNENGRWDPGNYYQNIQPEPIYAFFDEETKKYEFILRGGWTLDGLIIERRNSSGFIEDQNKPDLIDNIRLPIEIMEIDPEDLHN